MSNLPNPFWALMFCVLGSILIIVVVFHPGNEQIAMASITVSASLISGAFGYINGHSAGVASVRIPNQIQQSVSSEKE